MKISKGDNITTTNQQITCSFHLNNMILPYNCDIFFDEDFVEYKNYVTFFKRLLSVYLSNNIRAKKGTFLNSVTKIVITDLILANSKITTG